MGTLVDRNLAYVVEDGTEIKVSRPDRWMRRAIEATLK